MRSSHPHRASLRSALNTMLIALAAVAPLAHATSPPAPTTAESKSAANPCAPAPANPCAPKKKAKKLPETPAPTEPPKRPNTDPHN